MILQNYTGRNTDEVSRIKWGISWDLCQKIRVFFNEGIFKDSHVCYL